MALNTRERKIVNSFLRMGIVMADASLNDAIKSDNSDLMLKAVNDRNALLKAIEELELADLAPIELPADQPDVSYNS